MSEGLRIGELLKAAGLITDTQLTVALEEQVAFGRTASVKCWSARAWSASCS